jgi:hypothetical protein
MECADADAKVDEKALDPTVVTQCCDVDNSRSEGQTCALIDPNSVAAYAVDCDHIWTASMHLSYHHHILGASIVKVSAGSTASRLSRYFGGKMKACLGEIGSVTYACADAFVTTFRHKNNLWCNPNRLSTYSEYAMEKVVATIVGFPIGFIIMMVGYTLVGVL